MKKKKLFWVCPLDDISLFRGTEVYTKYQALKLARKQGEGTVIFELVSTINIHISTRREWVFENNKLRLL